MDKSITGIGVVPVQYTEYFNQGLLDQYVSSMTPLQSILNNPLPSTNPNDYDMILQSVLNLANLARNGVERTSEPNIPSAFMNVQMGNSLNEVMQTLKVVGISASSSFNIPDSQKIAAVQQWQNLASFGAADIVNTAVALSTTLTTTTTINPLTQQTIIVPISPEKTAQSMLELEYVKTSNNYISSKLVDLQSALQITTNVLNALNGLQLISNQQTVMNKPGFDVDYRGDLTQFKDNYINKATAYFTALSSNINFNANVPSDLWATRRQLVKLNAQIDPASSLSQNLTTIINDIQSAYTNSTQPPTPVTTIDSDFDHKTAKDFNISYINGAAQWVLDTTSKGAIGTTNYFQHLALATTTAQNLSDNQKDDVRSYAYVFQQFYETASAMLDNINKALKKMGQSFQAR